MQFKMSVASRCVKLKIDIISEEFRKTFSKHTTSFHDVASSKNVRRYIFQKMKICCTMKID